MRFRYSCEVTDDPLWAPTESHSPNTKDFMWQEGCLKATVVAVTREDQLFLADVVSSFLSVLLPLSTSPFSGSSRPDCSAGLTYDLVL